MAELTIKLPQLTRRRLWIGAGELAASLVLAGVAIAYLSRSTGLAAIAPDISGFTPYYFAHKQPPDGYSVDNSNSKFSDGVLQITLVKPGGPSVVVSEQAMSGSLSTAGLLANTTAVNGAAGPAGVISVEGRVVGTMVPNGQRTLVLVNAPGAVSTSNVADILKSLVPA